MGEGVGPGWEGGGRGGGGKTLWMPGWQGEKPFHKLIILDMRMCHELVLSIYSITVNRLFFVIEKFSSLHETLDENFCILNFSSWKNFKTKY